MKPLVSVIIPTYNSASEIECCLRSIQRQSYPEIEVIVVDNYSLDNTREIARKFGAKIIKKKAGRSQARNVGAKIATGKFFLSLDSDMELTLNVVMECVNKAKEGYDLLIIPEVSVGVGFWAECKALEKSFYIGDESIEASRFFKREVFESVNGYDPELEFGEDWDLQQRIKKSGYKIGGIISLLKHHEGKLSLREIILKKHLYGETLKHYQMKHPKEAKKQLRLIRPAFIRNWRKLAKDPVHASGMLVMKICEFVAVYVGSFK